MITTTEVGPGSLTIGPPDALSTLSEQATSCTLTPSVDKGDPRRVLSGGTAPGDRTETFTLDGSLLQDLQADDSVVLWLWENRGTVKPFTYVPNDAASVTISGDLEVEAVAIGGEAGTKPTSDFSFVVTSVTIS